MQLQKIKWDLTKDRFPSEVKEVIICNHCGWLIYNPRDIDIACGNCEKDFVETESEKESIK